MVAEENPAEGHEMEGDKSSKKPTEASTAIGLVVMKKVLARPFMNSQCHSMHAAPGNEVETGTMPQSTKKHGNDEVDVLTHLAPSVAAQRDIDIVANPR